VIQSLASHEVPHQKPALEAESLEAFRLRRTMVLVDGPEVFQARGQRRVVKIVVLADSDRAVGGVTDQDQPTEPPAAGRGPQAGLEIWLPALVDHDDGDAIC